MLRKKNVFAQIFVRNFFRDGCNLYAVVWQEDDCFYVQFGSVTRKYKRKINAIKIFNEYIDNALVLYDNGE